MQNKSCYFAAVVFLLFAVFPLSTPVLCTAAVITGTVNNGTTGAPLSSGEVTLVNPAAGMKTEQTVAVEEGRYRFESIESGTYLVQVGYDGVSYRQSAQVTDDDTYEVDVFVYEAASSWEGVRVDVPHFAATRQDDHLVIERVYDIFNDSSPPVTISGEDGYFSFPVPEDLHSFHVLYASFNGIPVERQPSQAADKEAYRVEYPIRPGLTRMAMSYEVGYHDSAYELNEKLHYDIDRFVVVSTDADITIVSSSHTLTKTGDPGSPASWVAENLKAGDVFNLRISGGTSHPPAGGTPRPVVKTVSNSAEPLSVLLMIITGLALLAFLAVASREQDRFGVRAKYLDSHRKTLLARLARLDDIYESGAVSAAAYHSRRQTLKKQIASLVLHLDENARGNPQKRTDAESRDRNEEGSNVT